MKKFCIISQEKANNLLLQIKTVSDFIRFVFHHNDAIRRNCGVIVQITEKNPGDHVIDMENQTIKLGKIHLVQTKPPTEYICGISAYSKIFFGKITKDCELLKFKKIFYKENEYYKFYEKNGVLFSHSKRKNLNLYQAIFKHNSSIYRACTNGKKHFVSLDCYFSYCMGFQVLDHRYFYERILVEAMQFSYISLIEKEYSTEKSKFNINENNNILSRYPCYSVEKGIPTYDIVTMYSNKKKYHKMMVDLLETYNKDPGKEIGWNIVSNSEKSNWEIMYFSVLALNRTTSIKVPKYIWWKILDFLDSDS